MARCVILFLLLFLIVNWLRFGLGLRELNVSGVLTLEVTDAGQENVVRVLVILEGDGAAVVAKGSFNSSPSSGAQVQDKSVGRRIC